jgi:hypothetical protein
MRLQVPELHEGAGKRLGVTEDLIEGDSRFQVVGRFVPLAEVDVEGGEEAVELGADLQLEDVVIVEEPLRPGEEPAGQCEVPQGPVGVRLEGDGAGLVGGVGREVGAGDLLRRLGPGLRGAWRDLSQQAVGLANAPIRS